MHRKFMLGKVHGVNMISGGCFFFAAITFTVFTVAKSRKNIKAVM